MKIIKMIVGKVFFSALICLNLNLLGAN